MKEKTKTLIALAFDEGGGAMNKATLTRDERKQDAEQRKRAEAKARPCRLRFSMDADAAEWWKAKAEEMGVDMGDLMRGALEAWKERAEKDGAGWRFSKVEEMPLWLTPKECAKIMGLHHLTVLKWIRTGVIPSRKFGSRRMVSRDFFGSGSFPWTRNRMPV